MEASVQSLDGGSSGRSGFYRYANWHEDSEGNRAVHGLPGSARRSASLIATTFCNWDAPDAAYALVLDVDVHLTDARYLDSEGRVDLALVKAALKEALPISYHHLTIACSSTSGKGLHLFFSMVPVVLSSDGDRPAEETARRVQRALIAAVRELGIGADPAAAGLRRQVSNFNNPDLVLFHDRKKREKIENLGRDNLSEDFEDEDDAGILIFDQRPLRVMWRELEASLRKSRREKRLYPENEKTEKGLASLLCFLTGWLFDKERSRLGQLWCHQGGFERDGFSSVRLTMDELRTICGDLSDPTIRKLIRNRSEILAEHDEGTSEWVLQANPEFWSNLEKAADIANRGGVAAEVRLWNSPWSLPEPEQVVDGQHNQYLVWLMNCYKSRGYSEVEALAKIRLRMGYCPGAMASRTIKRIEKKLRNFYRNSSRLHGRYADLPLPKWLEDDGEFLQNRVQVKTGRRGFLLGEKNPCREPLSSPEEKDCLVCELSSIKFPGFEGSGFRERELLGTTTSLFVADSEDVQVVVKLLAVVRWRHHVGIFDGERLLFVTTNSRHFVASKALEILSGQEEFAGMDLKFWYPKRSHARMVEWQGVLDSQERVPAAAAVLGRKESREEALDRWFDQRGIARRHLSLGITPADVQPGADSHNDIF